VQQSQHIASYIASHCAEAGVPHRWVSRAFPCMRLLRDACEACVKLRQQQLGHVKSVTDACAHAHVSTRMRMRTLAPPHCPTHESVHTRVHTRTHAVHVIHANRRMHKHLHVPAALQPKADLAHPPRHAVAPERPCRQQCSRTTRPAN